MNLPGIQNPTVLAFPMHGDDKMRLEGYRTRDGHICEWFGRLEMGGGSTLVVSRPEPAPVRWLARARRRGPTARAKGLLAHSPTTLRLPRMSSRQLWWRDSLRNYSLPQNMSTRTPAIVWNPMVLMSSISREVGHPDRRVVFDLLDDWTVHYAFQPIAREVSEGYTRLFDRADVVVANSEGTAELAERFGRPDVVLIPNGCDPEKFTLTSRAQGRGKVGYVGKIGKRLDLPGILSAVEENPSLDFVFAGPILDSEYEAPLRKLPNVTLLGDIHYEAVPALLETFDLGWVPHRVGDGEIGGDVIKTYEYRAAGLPVLTTPVIGAGQRGLSSVTVAAAREHTDQLRRIFGEGIRLPRTAQVFSPHVTWRSKAEAMGSFLNLQSYCADV